MQNDFGSPEFSQDTCSDWNVLNFTRRPQRCWSQHHQSRLTRPFPQKVKKAIHAMALYLDIDAYTLVEIKTKNVGASSFLTSSSPTWNPFPWSSLETFCEGVLDLETGLTVPWRPQAWIDTTIILEEPKATTASDDYIRHSSCHYQDAEDNLRWYILSQFYHILILCHFILIYNMYDWGLIGLPWLRPNKTTRPELPCWPRNIKIFKKRPKH